MAKATLTNKITTIQELKDVQRQIPRQQLIRLMNLVEQSNTALVSEINKAVDENPALEIMDEESDYNSNIDNSDLMPSSDNFEDGVFSDSSDSEYDYEGNPKELSGSDKYGDENPYEIGFENDSDDLTEAEIEREISRLNAPEIKDRTDNSLIYASHDSQMDLWCRQLDEMEMTDKQSEIAHYLLGSLENNGYLKTDLTTIRYELIVNFNIYAEVSEIEEVLTNFVQQLEPIGTGARSLQECLLLQLRNISEQTASVQMAIRIITESFDHFINKRMSKIRTQLSISQDEMKNAYEIIQKLDPNPVDTSTVFEEKGGYITPDFIITSVDGKLNLSLNNQYIPRLKVSKEFQSPNAYQNRALAQRLEDASNRFIREYVDKANQFISLLSTREKILYNTMYAIMLRQKDYFLSGDDAHLKPMVLKDIANVVGVDIATVSRVSNSKYVLTDFGTISLKHLFSEAVNNEEVSSKAIKSILSDVIENEDKSQPYSDEKLCEIMKEKGYDLARRTVAKYRAQLKIPTSHKRKEVQ